MMKVICSVIAALGLAVSPAAAGHHGRVAFASHHGFGHGFGFGYGHGFSHAYVAATPVVATTTVYTTPVVVALPAVSYPVVTAPVAKASVVADPAPVVVSAPTYCAPVATAGYTAGYTAGSIYTAPVTFAAGYGTGYGFATANVVKHHRAFNVAREVVVVKSAPVSRAASKPVVVKSRNTTVIVGRGARKR